MQKVYVHLDLARVAHVQGLLEQAGIRAEILNAAPGGAVGEIPFQHAAPELWVADDDLARAREIIERYLAEQETPADGTPWRCPRCGRMIEGQFTACWNCEYERDEAAGG